MQCCDQDGRSAGSLLRLKCLLHTQNRVLAVAAELDVDTLQRLVFLAGRLLDAESVSFLVLIVRSMILTLGHVCFYRRGCFY